MRARNPGDCREGGPNDNVYELVFAKRQITFGNSVNGACLPQPEILVTYAVSDGSAKRVALNRNGKLLDLEHVWNQPDPYEVAGGIRTATTAAAYAVAAQTTANVQLTSRSAKELPLEAARAYRRRRSAARTGVVPLVALTVVPVVKNQDKLRNGRWLGNSPSVVLRYATCGGLMIYAGLCRFSHGSARPMRA